MQRLVGLFRRPGRHAPLLAKPGGSRFCLPRPLLFPLPLFLCLCFFFFHELSSSSSFSTWLVWPADCGDGWPVALRITVRAVSMITRSVGVAEWPKNSSMAFFSTAEKTASPIFCTTPLDDDEA